MRLIKIDDPYEKRHICDTILRALPDWFGNENAITDYVDACVTMPFFAVMDGCSPVGFAALKRHNEHTYEVCVMGVLETHHRLGAGRMLIGTCMDYAREAGARFLTVKTLDESREDEGYARTRAFYRAMGFLPLEVFAEIWDKDNPCLFMTMWLG